jgi:hypothetical protein
MERVAHVHSLDDVFHDELALRLRPEIVACRPTDWMDTTES